MKILIVSEFFPAGDELRFSGGVEARNFFVARALAKKHDVTVLSSRMKAGEDTTQMHGFTVRYAGPARPYAATTGSPVERVRFIGDAIKVGARTDFDLIEGTNFLTHFVARRVARVKKRAAVAWYPDVWIGEWIAHAGVATGLAGETLERLNLGLPGFRRYIAISEQTKRKLAKHTKQPIDLIYCGVDDAPLEGVAKATDPTLICVARFVKYKNHAFLLRAFARAKERVPNARLVLIGSGPERGAIEALARTLGVFERVSILSEIGRGELLRQLAAAHVFSLASLVEGFGIATIEAARQGLPYVATDLDVHKEVLQERGGFLVSPNDEALFADKIAALLGDADLRAAKSRDASGLAATYDWGAIAAQTEVCFEQALSDFARSR